MKIKKKLWGGRFGGGGGGGRFGLGGGVRMDAKCERGIDTHCLCKTHHLHFTVLHSKS